MKIYLLRTPLLALMLASLLFMGAAAAAPPESNSLEPRVLGNGALWQIETVDSSGDVGRNAALALDSNGRSHVAYHDTDNDTLNYAAYDGFQWQLTTVAQAGGGDGEAFVDLALDADDHAHISYHSAFTGDLHYAHFDGTTWLTATVDSVGLGITGRDTAIAVDSQNRPHISYFDASTRDLRYASWNGALWQTETVDNAENTGRDTDIALDSQDRPHISYSESYPDPGLHYAVRNGTSWQRATVDSTGRDTSLALDSQGRPHIAYYDSQAQDLRYAYFDGSAWQGETAVSSGNVGMYASLALTGEDEPHICYYNYTNTSLDCALSDAISWYSLAVDEAADVGSYASLALDEAGRPFLAYYDQTNGDLKYATNVPLRFYRRAAELIEEVRGTEMAPGWETAVLGSDVQLLYRPDVADVAYYEFPIVVPTAGSEAATDAGFIIVATAGHDFPIAHWNYEGASPTRQLRDQAALGAETVARFYKLDTLVYAGENAAGDRVAYLGEELMQINGVPASWLTEPPELFEQIWTPDGQAADDAGAGALGGILYTAGPTAPPDTLTWSAWPSWTALKAGYAGSYEVLLAGAREAAREEWENEVLTSTEGGYLRYGDFRLHPLLWEEPVILLSGPGADQVQTAVIPRSGLPDLLQLTVIKEVSGAERSLQISVSYNTSQVQEKLNYVIYNPYQTYLPLINTTYAGLVSTARAASGDSIQGTTQSWWAGGFNDQRWYWQMEDGEGPNTSSCYSGCGATAWAMLFGWADYQAELNNPAWAGRWGLYRVSGGYGPDAVAPVLQDTGVQNMTWEVRGTVDTFCVAGSGATWPHKMDNAYRYLENRSYTRLLTKGNSLWPRISVRNRARETIRNRENPVVIGVSLTGGAHYALAYGYKHRKHNTIFGPIYTGRKFYVNYGWGDYDRGWIPAITWFAGEIRPHAAAQANIIDDVALYRPSDHKWYYDYRHNGDINAVSKEWGKQTGDLPLAGDFDRDGLMDDVAIFRQNNQTWYYDYDHDGDTDATSGPWGKAGDRPVSGDFDRDGFVDDVAYFWPAGQTWFFDYNHNGNTNDVQRWGTSEDIPFTGDFDQDGYWDDIALFRPSTIHTAFYNYDHDHTTDEIVNHFTYETGLPVVADYDDDGHADDVAFYLPDWEPEPIWFVDYDHNGPPNTAFTWGWTDGLPVAGAFGEDQDP